MSELAACEVLGGVEGAGWDRRVATLDDSRDSFQSGSPGGGGSVDECLSGLLGASHKGGVQGSSEDTGEEEVRVVSPGL